MITVIEECPNIALEANDIGEDDAVFGSSNLILIGIDRQDLLLDIADAPLSRQFHHHNLVHISCAAP